MHGRVKTKINKEEELKEKNEEQEKAALLNEGFKEVISKRNSVEEYDEVLVKSGELLILNPDIYTLWNIRRTILLYKQKNLSIEDFKEMCKQENYLVEKCLAINPKSYSAWHQRAWVMNHMPDPNWAHELSLCSKFLNYDERNFHCWDHRRFVVAKSKISPQSELEFTLQKIHQNFSNYSAWHYRSRLWEEKIQAFESQSTANENKPIPSESELSSAPIRDHVIATDRSLVDSAIFTDPFDQSAWFYMRWLISVASTPSPLPHKVVPVPKEGCDRLTPSAPHLYGDWLKEGELREPIGQPKNKMASGGESAAAAHKSTARPVMLYARRAGPASLIFALDCHVRRIICVDSSVGQKLEDYGIDGQGVGWFDPNSRHTFYFKLTLNGREYPVELLDFRPLYPGAVDRASADPNFVGDPEQLFQGPSDVWMIRNLNSDWTSLVDEALTFTLSTWKSQCEPLTVCIKSTFKDGRSPLSGPLQNSGNECNPKVLKLLEENMSICDQLTELEPNNKWSLLTWIWIVEEMGKYGERKADDNLAKGMNECIEKLLKIDPARKGYYNYLRSKFMLESKLKSLRAKRTESHSDFQDGAQGIFGSLDLTRGNLQTIALPLKYKLDCLLLSCVDVSFNNLTSLSWCKGLSCLKRLRADDNNLTDTRGLENCLFLEYISLKNNRIESVEKDLTSLSGLPNLKCLILKGNPLCYSPHFPEELYACLPNTLGVLNDYSDQDDFGDAC